MGIGTLRRYHPATREEDRAKAHQAEDPVTREHMAAVVAEIVALQEARDAAQAALEAAQEGDADEAAVTAATTAAQEAQEALEAKQKEFDTAQSRWDEALPKRSASKGDWIAFAATQGRDEASLVDEGGKALTRDAIAELYLGPKE